MEDFDSGSELGFFENLKQSIARVGIGFILILASIVILFWNEKSAVKTMRDLKKAESECISVSTDKVLPANEGKLVHITGVPVANDKATIDNFASLQTPKLVMQVEMYQWKESREQDNAKSTRKRKVYFYRYEKVWSKLSLDSKNFRGPNRDTHQNPDESTWLFKSQKQIAKDVTVGKFKLAPMLVHWLKADQLVKPEEAVATKNKLKIFQNYYYKADDPQMPKVGDLRIRILQTKPGDFSFIAQQRGQELAKFVASGDKEFPTMVVPGKRTMKEMFTQRAKENQFMTWMLRLGGFVLCFIGMMMLIGPLTLLASYVPILGDIVKRCRVRRNVPDRTDGLAGHNRDRLADLQTAYRHKPDRRRTARDVPGWQTLQKSKTRQAC